MEDSLKGSLKRLKANESTISMILGGLVVVVVAVLLLNYFKQSSPTPQISPESAVSVAEDMDVQDLETQLDETVLEENEESDLVAVKIETNTVVKIEPEESQELDLEINEDEAKTLGFADIIDEEATMEAESDASTGEKLVKVGLMAGIINGVKSIFESNDEPRQTDLPSAESTAAAELAVENEEVESLSPTEKPEEEVAEVKDIPEDEDIAVVEDEAEEIINTEIAESTETEVEDANELSLLDRIKSIFGGNNEESESTRTGDLAEENSYDLGPDLPLVHTIVEGEHLWKIAEKYYGSGYNWIDIAEINGLGEGDLVATGQQISIPDVPKRSAGGTIQQKITTRQKVDVSATIEGEGYTVVKGDNLWIISVKVYGNGLMWNTLYDANDDVLTSPDVIEVGQNLRVPQE